MRRTAALALALAVVLAAGGCSIFLGPDPEPGEADAGPDPEPVDLEINRKLDILFVIDDSGSMAEEQAALAAGFGSFEAQLAQIAGGHADVRVGVVSTNTGAILGVSQCGDEGDGGQLLGAQCTSDGSPFLRFSDGGSNAVDSVSATFGCMATLGTGGCGFEQPLDSARRALDGSADNQGFARDDAALLLIVVTDEDDCSIADRAGFFADPEADLSSALGPFSSFRCFEHGIACDPDDPRSSGDKSGCGPRDGGGLVAPIAGFVEFFAGLKPEGRFAAGAVYGQPDAAAAGGLAATVRPNPDPGPQNGNPDLAPVCSDAGLGEADPGIRLATFLDGFALSSQASICSDDLTAPLAAFADLAADPLSLACVPAGLTCTADARICDDVADTGCAIERPSAAGCPGAAIEYRYADSDAPDLSVQVSCR